MPTAELLFVLPFAHRGPQPQEPKNVPAGPTPREEGAATAAPGAPQGPSGPGPNAQPMPCDTTTFMMLGLFMALMWFMVMRPESKRRKETAAMLAALKQGDTVVTIGGMHGVVDSIAEKTVLLRVGDQRLTFDRSAIARVVRDESARDAGRK